MIRRKKMIRDSRRRRAKRSLCLLRLEGKAFLLALVLFFVACMVGCHYMIYYTLSLYLLRTESPRPRRHQQQGTLITEQDNKSASSTSKKIPDRNPLIGTTVSPREEKEGAPVIGKMPRLGDGTVVMIHNGHAEVLEHFGQRVSLDRDGNVHLRQV